MSLNYFIWTLSLMIWLYSLSGSGSSFWDLLFFSEESFIVLLFLIFLSILHMHRDAGTAEFNHYSAEIRAAASKSYIDLLISLNFITESHNKMLDYTSELLSVKDFIDSNFSEVVQSLKLEASISKLDNSILEVFEMTSTYLAENTFLFQRNLVDTLFYEQQLLSNWVDASNITRMNFSYDESEASQVSTYKNRLYSIGATTNSSEIDSNLLAPSVVLLLSGILFEKNIYSEISSYYSFFSDFCSILFGDFADSESLKFYAENPSDSYLTNPLFVSEFPTDFAEISQKSKTFGLLSKLYSTQINIG
jgi:hypothetical protein